jgi:DNA-binding XRE family transcriptional regulator
MGYEAGRLLRQRRLAAGLTQQQLAERSGMSLRTLRDLEHGRVQRPQPRSVQRLAAALGLSSEERAALVTPGEGVPDGSGRLWLGILGPLVIRVGGADVPLAAHKPRQLLALLALSAPSAVTTDEIVDVLWEQPPRTCLPLVTGYVSRLRKLLEPASSPQEAAAVLVHQHGGYRLRCEPGQLDRLWFGELASRAQRAQADGQAELALRLYDQALGCASARQRPP